MSNKKINTSGIDCNVTAPYRVQVTQNDATIEQIGAYKEQGINPFEIPPTFDSTIHFHGRDGKKEVFVKSTMGELGHNIHEITSTQKKKPPVVNGSRQEQCFNLFVENYENLTAGKAQSMSPDEKIEFENHVEELWQYSHDSDFLKKTKKSFRMKFRGA